MCIRDSSYCTTNLRGIRRRTRCRRHRQGREWQRVSVRASQRYRRVGRDTLWVTQSIVRGQCLLLQFVQMVLKVCCAARDARHRSSRRRRRHLPTWLRWNGGQWPTCGTLHMRCRVACRLLPCHDRRTLVLDRLQRCGRRGHERACMHRARLRARHTQLIHLIILAKPIPPLAAG